MRISDWSSDVCSSDLVRRLVVPRRRDARAEADVATQVEPVRDMLEIAHDLRLTGIALGPGPLLLEFVGEGKGIVVALGIAARAGIAVPVPSAAHTVGRFQDLRRQRSEEHTSELQSLMRISYAVCCLKKK